MKRGQQNEFLMVKPSGEVFRTGRIFSNRFDFETPGDTLESDISSGAATSFHIECEDVDELVSDQRLLAYASSSTSLTLKV